MLKKYAETGKANTREAKNMENQLNKAKLALVQTEKELKQTAEQLYKAETATNEFDNTLDDMNETADKSSGILSNLGESLNIGSLSLNTGMTAVAGGVAALGAAAVATGKYAIDFATDVEKSSNSFVASTGTAKNEAEAFEDAMLDIYNDNFGEDLNDISVSMAEVAKQTKEVDPKKVAELTEYALMLRDTFGYDVNEQIRTANMLMEQFEISGVEAFTLIAQGAQKGLDKNGDMLDTINEYSVQFQQLGFSAEEMFDILINGAESGVFSVDKAGDAVKEFEIRVKDGSDSTAGAFEDLGLNVEEISSDFAAGGDKAQQAFKKVTNALFAMEDPLKQNQTGVALFGTMWEDLGVDGVKALTTLTKQVDKTADTLDDINEIKYDDLESAFEGAGRAIQTGFVKPIGDKALPAFKDFAETISEGAKEANGDIEKMSDVFGEAVGDLASDLTAFIPDFIDLGGEIVIGLVDGIAEAAPELGEAVGELSAEFINNLPDLAATVFDGGVQLISGFVSGLVEGVPLLDALFGDIVNRNKEVYDALEANIENVTAFSEAIKNAEPSVADYDSLIDEYGNSLSDLNTNISETESAITETLSQALKDQQKLREEDLENVEAYTDKLYEEQLNKLEFYRQQQNVELLKIKNDVQNLTQENAAQYLADAQAALDAANTATEAAYEQRLGIIQNKYTAMGELGSEAYNNEINETKEFYDEQMSLNQKGYSDVVDIVSQASRDWLGVDKDKWESLSELSESYNQETLQGRQNYLDTMTEMELTSLGITNKGVNDLRDLYTTAWSQINLDNTNGFLTVIAETQARGEEIDAENKKIVSNILSNFEGLPPELDESGKQALLSLIDGLDYYVPDLENAADLTANDIVGILRSEWGLDSERGGGGRSFENIGSEAMTDLKNGIGSGQDDANTAGSEVANSALSGTKINNGDRNYNGFWGAGSNASVGFGNGLRSNDGWVSSLSEGLAKLSLEGMARGLDSRSPSRKFMKLGVYSAQGYTIGFEKEFARSKNILSRAIEVNASPKVLASAVNAKSASRARTAANVTVVQNIYAKDTSYFGQQQEAARQLELVTRRLNN